ncbi:MAG: hypothetical protein IJQ37_06475 [Clostridia bacterium]|nr:hypothetical protein [Clostridia bacterium]
MSKTNSTKELIGIRSFGRNGLMTDRNNEIVYFIIKPSNISVLSDISIGIKVTNLMHLLSAQPNIEMICSDARESFEANKEYLNKRIGEEENRKVVSLLKADKAFLDNIQLQMSTAREFMFAVRVRDGSEEQNFASLNRVEKAITGEGFECKRATVDDIKRFLTRYFGWNVPDENIDDSDGDRAVRKWVLPDLGG